MASDSLSHKLLETTKANKHKINTKQEPVKSTKWPIAYIAQIDTYSINRYLLYTYLVAQKCTYPQTPMGAQCYA